MCVGCQSRKGIGGDTVIFVFLRPVQIDFITDSARCRNIVGSGLPLDGDGIGLAVRNGQARAADGRRGRVRSVGTHGQTVIVAGILEAIAGLVEGFDAERILGGFLQVGECVGRDSRFFFYFMPRIVRLVGHREPHLVQDLVLLRDIVRRRFPFDGNAVNGRACQSDRPALDGRRRVVVGDVRLDLEGRIRGRIPETVPRLIEGKDVYKVVRIFLQPRESMGEKIRPLCGEDRLLLRAILLDIDLIENLFGLRQVVRRLLPGNRDRAGGHLAQGETGFRRCGRFLVHDAGPDLVG